MSMVYCQSAAGWMARWSHWRNISAVSHNKQLVWGHLALFGWTAFSDESWGMCFWVELLTVVSICGLASRRVSRGWNEPLRNHTLAYSAGLHERDCRVTRTWSRHSILSYFSKAETSAASVSILCAAVGDDDWGWPELSESFLLLRLLFMSTICSRFSRYDHNVGGSNLWDWQLTFHTSSEPKTRESLRFRTNARFPYETVDLCFFS